MCYTGFMKKQCTVAECTKKYLAKGYCGMHYQRWVKSGDPLKMAGTPHGEGKPWKDPKGYVILPPRYGKDHPNRKWDGRIYEHVYVMSTHLGRPLEEHENVHHKNGVRDDNRLENLELWSRSQPAGQRVEDKLQWAVELLNQYKDEYPDILKGLIT